ncbi:hypothetical protein BH23GEM11_BH23GEM11_00080 [soil metagenome]
MRGHPTARRVICRGLVAGVSVALGGLPLGAQVQQPDTASGPPIHRPVPSLGPDGWVEGAMAAGIGLTTIRGQGVAVAHVSGKIALGPRLRIGAEAVLPLDGVALDGEGLAQRSALHMRYGGARIEGGPRDSRWTGGLLLGAGTARVRTPGVASTTSNRNFLVVEPSVRLSTGSLGPLRHGLAVAGRIPLGTPALPGVRRNDLYGVSLSLTTEWVRDP